MYVQRPSFFAVRSIFCLSALALGGCDGAFLTTKTPADAIAVGGNWQLRSSAVTAAKLNAFSGELTGSSASMSGIFHSDSASACVSPSNSFAVNGAADSKNMVTLTGSLAGGTLTVSGQLAADGRSLINPTYNVSGGSCAFATAATATATAYSPITGNYTGSFSDPGGQVITITASLTQTPASDPNGNFTLSGSGSFANNPCFSSPVAVSGSQVTGGSFNLTYADSTTQNSVNAMGTFSTDGTTLNVTQWTLTGPCGPDSGTGVLTR